MKPTRTLLTALLLAPLGAHAQHAVVATRPEPAGSNRIVLVERGEPRAVVVTADAPTAMAAVWLRDIGGSPNFGTPRHLALLAGIYTDEVVAEAGRIRAAGITPSPRSRTRRRVSLRFIA